MVRMLRYRGVRLCTVAPGLLYMFVCMLHASAAYDCTGKPETAAEVHAHWLEPSYKKFERPAIGLQRASMTTTGKGAVPILPPDDVYVVFQMNRLMDVDSKAATIS